MAVVVENGAPEIWCDSCYLAVDVPDEYLEMVRPKGGGIGEVWVWRDGAYSVNITALQRKLDAANRKLAKHERKLAKRRALYWADYHGGLRGIDVLAAKALEVNRWWPASKLKNRCELVAMRWHKEVLASFREQYSATASARCEP